MAYKKPANEWTDLIKVVTVPRNENSQLRISVICKDGDMTNPFLSIREFAKYVTKEERAMGLKPENAIFRPSTNGCTMPLCGADDFVAAMQKAIKDADKVLKKAGIDYRDEMVV